MNTRKAGKLRKEVFGGMKQPTIEKREYATQQTDLSPKAKRRGFGGFPTINAPGSPRAKYLAAKKESK